MIEITNNTKSPLQLMVRSRKKTRSFTTLVLPGRGSNNHKLVIEDEVFTDNINRLVSMGLVAKRHM